MRPNCVTGTLPHNCSAGVAFVGTRSSNRYRARGALHISLSRPATRRLPPRSSHLCPDEPAAGSWHHPPCPSGSPADHAPLTNHGNSRPTAPVRRSEPCAPFVGSISSAKCSAASVGPNRSSSEPEHWCLIKLMPRRRNFAGLMRLEARPGLPCCGPFAAQPLVAPPQAFDLAITQLQHCGRICHLQFRIGDSSHHLYSLQAASAHAVLFNRTSSGWRSQFKGTFLFSPGGDFVKKFQQADFKPPAEDFDCLGIPPLFSLRQFWLRICCRGIAWWAGRDDDRQCGHKLLALLPESPSDRKTPMS